MVPRLDATTGPSLLVSEGGSFHVVERCCGSLLQCSNLAKYGAGRSALVCRKRSTVPSIVCVLLFAFDISMYTLLSCSQAVAILTTYRI